MKEKTKREYVRRSQRDYSMPFKLAVVSEIERGETFIPFGTTQVWDLRKCNGYKLVEKIWYL